MRPPKLILLAGSDEYRMGVRAFLLKTRGYAVATAATAKKALAVLELFGHGLTGEVDLLLIDLPLLDFTPEILGEAKRAHPQLHTLVTSNHAGWYNPWGADVLLPSGYDSPAELLERIRILVARKHGPRKTGDGEQGMAEQKKPVAVARPLFGHKSKRKEVA